MYTFVKPSVTLLDQEDLELKVEQCYRICYKSEHKMQENDRSFLKSIVNQTTDTPHWSPLEHARIELEVSNFVGNTLKQWEYNRGTKFLTLSPVENGRYRVTGNFRTLKEFIVDDSRPNVTLYAQGALSYLLSQKYPNIFLQSRSSKYQSELRREEIQRPYTSLWQRIKNNLIDRISESDVEVIGQDPFYATFHIVTTRDILQELARHRSMSFSVESTRYCNYGKRGIVFTYPDPYPWARELRDEFSESKSPKAQMYLEAIEVASTTYEKMLEEGMKPQEARMVLPGALKTELIMTGTYKAWEHFIKLRCSSAAHPQIRLLAEQIEKLIKAKKEAYQN